MQKPFLPCCAFDETCGTVIVPHYPYTCESDDSNLVVIDIDNDINNDKSQPFGAAGACATKSCLFQSGSTIRYFFRSTTEEHEKYIKVFEQCCHAVTKLKFRKTDIDDANVRLGFLNNYETNTCIGRKVIRAPYGNNLTGNINISDPQQYAQSICHTFMHVIGLGHQQNIAYWCMVLKDDVKEYYHNPRNREIFMSEEAFMWYLNNFCGYFFFDTSSSLLPSYPKELYNNDETKRRLDIIKNSDIIPRIKVIGDTSFEGYFSQKASLSDTDIEFIRIVHRD